MSNPKYGNRSDMYSKNKLGLSNGSVDSRTLREHGIISNMNLRQQKSCRVRRSVYLWTASDVHLWLQKKHREHFELYGALFLEHDISGRALVRLNEMKLERMGVRDKSHRSELHEYIVRLRLKHEQNELKLLKKMDKD